MSGSSKTPYLVLLVDDDPMVRDVTKRLLERQELEVFPAEGVKDCREAFEVMNRPPTLALVDISLKEGRCDGLLQEIIDRYPSCHVAVMSGYDSTRLPSIPGKEIDFLQKPFNAESLRVLVDKIRGDTGGAAEQDGSTG